MRVELGIGKSTTRTMASSALTVSLDPSTPRRPVIAPDDDKYFFRYKSIMTGGLEVPSEYVSSIHIRMLKDMTYFSVARRPTWFSPAFMPSERAQYVATADATRKFEVYNSFVDRETEHGIFASIVWKAHALGVVEPNSFHVESDIQGDLRDHLPPWFVEPFEQLFNIPARTEPNYRIMYATITPVDGVRKVTEMIVFGSRNQRRYIWVLMSAERIRNLSIIGQLGPAVETLKSHLRSQLQEDIYRNEGKTLFEGTDYEVRQGCRVMADAIVAEMQWFDKTLTVTDARVKEARQRIEALRKRHTAA